MPNSTHFPVDRVLKRLGANISLARRRRHWTQKDLAEQMGTSVSTVRRLEIGDPGVRLTSLGAALHALGEIEQLNALLDTRTDVVGLICQDKALPKRIHARTLQAG
jgi:transcriptional regulator with XRE-family HTH domain